MVKRFNLIFNILMACLSGFHKKRACIYLSAQCNIDSDIFHTWVIQQLLPHIPDSAAIVRDNATFHTPDMKQAD